MSKSFLTVTELAGDEISQEQLDRMHHRYSWAASCCEGKDVVEVACGTGPGLGMLEAVASQVDAGDYDKDILEIAQSHYQDRINLEQVDGMAMPYPDQSKDVIILFEALYYIPDAECFVEECARILRPGGVLLLATANKDLTDFNPSPNSYRYYGVLELDALLSKYSFSPEFYGHLEVGEISARQKVLSPIKKAAVSLGLMPKTMAGKKMLKRIVFGGLVSMPFELQGDEAEYREAPRLDKSKADRQHKVIYCAATFMQ